MVGATLSRWSMSYFAVALLCLLGGEALMTAGFGFPAAALAAPDTLILVHLTAIGWLSLLILGALFQFVPVLIAKPIYSNRLPLPTLIALILGLAMLLLGFLQLGGHSLPAWPYLPTAAALLGTGFGLALWNLGLTLWPARPLPLPARFVAVGLVCGAATVTLGIIFALVLGGVAADPRLASLTASGIPVHAIAGLGGWLTLTAIGVSYRLLAMFMLAPEGDTVRSRLVLYFGTAALVLVIVGGTVVICLGQSLSTLLLISAVFGICALGLYAGDVLHLYRARKRRVIELNARMAAVAFACLGAVVLLSIALAAFGRFEAKVGTVVFLAGFGWLTGLGLSKLYKIVAFLTWLECYGPVLGKMATPRVQDLVLEKRAEKWFWLYFAAVWSATVCLLLDASLGFRASAAVMFVGTVGVVVQLVRTRRMADVKPELRQSHLTHRPALLASQQAH